MHMHGWDYPLNLHSAGFDCGDPVVSSSSLGSWGERTLGLLSWVCMRAGGYPWGG